MILKLICLLKKYVNYLKFIYYIEDYYREFITEIVIKLKDLKKLMSEEESSEYWRFIKEFGIKTIEKIRGRIDKYKSIS